MPRSGASWAKTPSRSPPVCNWTSISIAPAERISNYAFLKTAEDVGESKYQRMQGRYMNVASRSAQAASFIRPEILAIPAAAMTAFLESPVLAPFRLILQRLLRYKPHTLGGKEENLLAMQTEMAQAASQIFRQLTDADLRFGNITDHEGQIVELSHATFSAFFHSPEPTCAQEAFEQYYREYADHAHALAASLAGSMQADIYYARRANYTTALEAALFPDQVPATVYDNLISSVHVTCRRSTATTTCGGGRWAWTTSTITTPTCLSFPTCGAAYVGRGGRGRAPLA